MYITEFSYERSVLDPSDFAYYERMNPGYKCTGETLKETYRMFEDGERLVDYGSTTYVVFTGSFTRYGMCRDCGDHYIIAKWSRYDRINKKDCSAKHDVEDR